MNEQYPYLKNLELYNSCKDFNDIYLCEDCLAKTDCEVMGLVEAYKEYCSSYCYARGCEAIGKRKVYIPMMTPLETLEYHNEFS